MQSPYGHRTKGFTLIELLVVIAIVAVLSVAVILALNPAEMLKQSRDATRISDMSTLRSGLLLYAAEVVPVNLAVAGYLQDCFVTTTSTLSPGCGGRHRAVNTVASAKTRNIDGQGWVGSDGTAANGPNLTKIPAGAPFSALPVDPVNLDPYYYSYAADLQNTTFEFDAKMESKKYSNGGGSSDVESTDGGTSSTLYEVGTAPNLDL